jgi:hypothetical protein
MPASGGFGARELEDNLFRVRGDTHLGILTFYFSADTNQGGERIPSETENTTKEGTGPLTREQ